MKWISFTKCLGQSDLLRLEEFKNVNQLCIFLLNQPDPYELERHAKKL